MKRKLSAIDDALANVIGSGYSNLKERPKSYDRVASIVLFSASTVGSKSCGKVGRWALHGRE